MRLVRFSKLGVCSILTTMVCVPLLGCAMGYITPKGGANLSLIADQDIRNAFENKPAATIPVQLATVRIQESEYCSYTTQGIGTGAFSVVTVKDVEKDEDYARLNKMTDVSQVVALNRLLVNDQRVSAKSLRQGAAVLHADVVLIYTFDTKFFEQDQFKPLTVVSLGLSPNKVIKVTSTAAAILMDVRTGYVYTALESTIRSSHLASSWTSSDTIDESRRETERTSFEGLLTEMEKTWPQVLEVIKNNQ